MKEQDIQKKIITYLESIGAYVVKLLLISLECQIFWLA